MIKYENKNGKKKICYENTIVIYIIFNYILVFRSFKKYFLIHIFEKMDFFPV